MINIFNYFSEKRNARIRENLCNVQSKEELAARFTTLQNEIEVSFSTKVIAVTSVNNDELAALFAKGLADAYALNGESALLVDANLYEPRLADLLSLPEEENPSVQAISEKVSAICLKKEVYPSAVIKDGRVHEVLKGNAENFDHIVLLVPSIKKHKEIVLFKDVITAAILVTKKNRTRKGDIYNAVQYCAAEQLPLAKVTIIE